MPYNPKSKIQNPKSKIQNRLVILGYTLLTFFLTLPISLHLTEQVPGGGDAWQNIWNLWWVKDALLNLHTNPYHTDLLYYPNGVNLYFHTLALTAGVTGIPLQLLGFNLIATYNIVLLSSFVLAGYGMYLLCCYLTGNRWASFVGGIVFAFSPYHFAHLFGHMNLVSLQWIPFYVLVLLKAIDARGWGSGIRDQESGIGDVSIPNPKSGRPLGHQNPKLGRSTFYSAGAGALLALNAYTDWSYAIFLVMLTGLILAWKALVPSERRLSREAGVGWVEAGARLLIFCTTFLILTAPILLPTLAEARQGYAQQPPEETLFYSADAVSAFMPSELHPIWGKAIAEQIARIPPYLPLKNPSERVLFLGYAVLALSAFGVWKLRANRQVRFWAFTAVLMWLLSLGPVLQILGKRQFTVFNVDIPLPYLILFKLPLISIMRTPARLTVLIMLALAILVAFAMSYILASLLARRRIAEGRSQKAEGRNESIRNTQYAIRNTQYVTAIGIPLLIIFEFLSTPFPTVPPGWNVPIYAKIAQEQGNFALLELPLRPFGDYMAYQTIHGKPIIGGYIARQPPYPLEEQNPTVKYLLDATPLDSPLRDEVKDGKGVKALRDLGVKYVIIHWWAFTSDQKAAMQAKLGALVARPPDYAYPGDQVDVWQIVP